jgi:hypothetical protein
MKFARLFEIQWFQTLIQICHTVSKVVTNFKLWRLAASLQDPSCWRSLELEMKNKLAIGVETAFLVGSCNYYKKRDLAIALISTE